MQVSEQRSLNELSQMLSATYSGLSSRLASTVIITRFNFLLFLGSGSSNRENAFESRKAKTVLKVCVGSGGVQGEL